MTTVSAGVIGTFDVFQTAAKMNKSSVVTNDGPTTPSWKLVLLFVTVSSTSISPIGDSVIILLRTAVITFGKNPGPGSSLHDRSVTLKIRKSLLSSMNTAAVPCNAVDNNLPRNKGEGKDVQVSVGM